MSAPVAYTLELSRDEMDILLNDLEYMTVVSSERNPQRGRTRQQLLERLQALANPEPMSREEAIERSR